MARLALGTCKNCGHPMGNHSNQGKWLHYYHQLGPYVLSINCMDRPFLSPGFGACPCVTPELDRAKPIMSRFSL